MRKNLLQNVLAVGVKPQEATQAARAGASRSMIHSIEELAENSRRMADGETVVSLNTDVIDQSFVSDRIARDDEDYRSLRDAIAENGQSTPILVRPHPSRPGRYMIVYGHRRTQVAAELGRPVRAIVKQLEEIAHIIAQGQENSARANLSFIEKSLFAAKLVQMGQSKDVAKAALSVDDTLLSRMLSVVEVIPAPVIEAIGAARGIGRDRWEELKKLLAVPAKAQAASELAATEAFARQEEIERFAFLLARVKAGRPPPRPKTALSSGWSPPDKSVSATFRRSGKTFNLSLTARNAAGFGDYLLASLPGLYEAYLAAQTHRSEEG